METDEDVARRLQAEFDAEAQAVEKQQIRQDEGLAQRLASASHDFSDSDDEGDDAACHSPPSSPSPSSPAAGVRGEGVEDRTAQRTGSAGGDSHETYSRRMSGSQEKVTPVKSALQKEKSAGGGDKTGKKRPLCKFGSDCYRKNPWHLEEFYHPHLEDPPQDKAQVEQKSQQDKKRTSNASSSSSSKEGDETKQKKRKQEVILDTAGEKLSWKAPFASRLAASAPYNIFLNKTYSLPETKEDPLTLVFPDLLHPKLGEVVESAQLNFMVDLDFVMSNYKVGAGHNKPLLIMYGQMEGNPADYPALTCAKVNIPFQYGTHHTKMMLVQYRGGCRVVVHTANLVPDDWYEKTQGFWVSPVFPELEGGRESVLDGESPTRFKRDLIDYLQAYKVKHLTRWANILKKYDFSTCNVVFVGSIPGYHTDQKDRWGHMKVRRVMGQHASSWVPALPITVQCSSIGSLGKDKSWLCGELGLSLTGAKAGCSSLPRVQLVYPSEEDVERSSQGWMGGSCLPYHSTTHDKQTWLSLHLHVWRSERRKRTRAMPHIKTYARLSRDSTATQFFLLTSANLSKAAWGAMQKQQSQLFIRSYEAGVLLLPKFVTGSSEFELQSSSREQGLALPYDVPLTAYPDRALPWFINTPKTRPDVLGSTYP